MDPSDDDAMTAALNGLSPAQRRDANDAALMITQALLDGLQPGKPFRQTIEPGRAVIYTAADGTSFQITRALVAGPDDVVLTITKAASDGHVTASWNTRGDDAAGTH